MAVLTITEKGRGKGWNASTLSLFAPRSIHDMNICTLSSDKLMIIYGWHDDSVVDKFLKQRNSSTVFLKASAFQATKTL